MDLEDLTDADIATVAEQLGRPPRAAVHIAARCPAGHPAVIVNHPIHLESGQIAPFPTLYWLSCPELRRVVSRLEMGGLIQQLDARLAGDDELAAALHLDHERYIQQRWQLLSEEERAQVRDAGLQNMLLERGIGGLSHRRSVKCLHLHFAHHLADRNTIGSILSEEFEVRPCS
ncbi:MAG: DUF501 domain-containing protein [Planctomycetota bacterium]|nr:DUF501 domain-containing protein [Planctomycetota bacterium]